MEKSNQRRNFRDSDRFEYERNAQQEKQYRAGKRNHKPSKRDRAAKRPDKYGAWDK